MSTTEKIIKTFIAKFKADGSDLEKTYARLGSITDKFVNTITKAFSGILNAVTHPIETLQKSFKSLINVIKKSLNAALNVILHPIDSLKKGLVGLGKFASSSFKFMLTTPFKAMEATAKLSIKGIGKALKGIPAIAGAAFDKLSSITSSFTESMASFLDFDAKTNLSPEYVSRLSDAMASVGGSTDDAINMLDTLQQSLMDTSFGQGALIDAARKWGLTLHDSSGQLLSADKMLIEISKRMTRMSKAEQLDLINTLGLNDNALRLLQQGPSQLQNKMANATFVVNEKDIEAAKSIRESAARIKQTFKAIGLDIQRIIIPFIDKALGAIKEIPNALRKIFTDTEIGKNITKTIAPFFKYFNRQMQRVKTLLRGISIDGFAKSMPRIKEFFSGTFTDLGETLKNLITNGFSFLKEQGPTIGKFLIEAIKSAFTFLKESLPNMADFIGSAIGLAIKGVIDIGKWIGESIQGASNGDSIITGIKNLLSNIADTIKNIFIEFWNGLLGAAFNTSLSEIANNIKEWAKNILPDFVVDKLFKDKAPMPLTSQAAQNQMAQLSVPNTAPSNMPVINNTQNNTSSPTTNKIDINAPITITGNKTPEQTARAIKKELNSVRNAALQTSGGIL